eukprot:Tamp_17059.p1 GENE.Tamp_17059~~Tamp_17059.p1  ORF type:complete len:355 (-),score=52.77 Tamp_17059:354-1397(-)
MAGTPATPASESSTLQCSTLQGSRIWGQDDEDEDAPSPACERRKSLNHRELKAKLVMGRVSLQTATRYKEPEPESAAESSSDEELILRSELRPGREVKPRSRVKPVDVENKPVDVEYAPRQRRSPLPEPASGGSPRHASPGIYLLPEKVAGPGGERAEAEADPAAQEDSSEQEIQPVQVQPVRRSKPPTTPASPGQVLKMHRSPLNRKSNYYKRRGRQAETPVLAQQASDGEPASVDSEGATQDLPAAVQDEKPPAQELAVSNQLEEAEKAESSDDDYPYFRRRSAGRRQTSARQPSLRQSKALAEAPLTTRHETTVITICGDEVTVHTASNIGADVWGESGTTSVQ